MLRHEFNYLILLITCLTQLLADLEGGCMSIMIFKCAVLFLLKISCIVF